MLELTDDILLISSSITRSHLVMVLVHHLLHQVVLAVLALRNIVTSEALTGVLNLVATVSLLLHDIVLINHHLVNTLIGRVHDNAVVVLVVEGLRVIHGPVVALLALPLHTTLHVLDLLGITLAQLGDML